MLDSENIQVPGPIQAGDYEATASLLRVSKQVRNEAIPLLYSRNTVAVLMPWASLSSGLVTLSQLALQNITKVELRLIDGLTDMGRDGQLLLGGGVPALKHLRLNFWHARLWLRSTMELAYRAWQDGNFEVKLELYESVHDMHYAQSLDEDIIDMEVANARNTCYVYGLSLPSSLETITLSASAGSDAAYALVTYENDDMDWRFNKDGNKDTKGVRYLVWEAQA